IVGTSVGMVRARSARAEAVAQAGAASEQRTLAEAKSVEAQRQAGRAARGVGVLSEVLLAAGPGPAAGAGREGREVVDAAAARVGTELAEEPEARATVEETIGLVYDGLGLYDQALEHLSACVGLRRVIEGPDSLDLAETLGNLSGVQRRTQEEWR